MSDFSGWTSSRLFSTFSVLRSWVASTEVFWIIGCSSTLRSFLRSSILALDGTFSDCSTIFSVWTLSSCVSGFTIDGDAGTASSTVSFSIEALAFVSLKGLSWFFSSASATGNKLGSGFEITSDWDGLRCMDSAGVTDSTGSVSTLGCSFGAMEDDSVNIFWGRDAGNLGWSDRGASEYFCESFCFRRSDVECVFCPSTGVAGGGR